MNKDPEVKKVIILGSGFSRALHSLMPLTNHLTLLGGLNIGRDFECTAVLELRLSVSEVVGKLL